MVDPTTVNKALIVPNTGADVGTWGVVAINPDMVAIDGMLGGVATISVSSSPITLTAPSGAITPSAGPTQSQNCVLKFTGAIGATVRVTFPLPGVFVVENNTTGNNVLIFQSTSPGEVVSTPQGSIVSVYNDGTDVKFVKGISNIPGELTYMGGISTLPNWVLACTRVPFVIADGTIFNVSSFPALGALYGSSFGGNGITTFGVPDLQGRVPLAYDGTGARITVAGCGINGHQLGAAGGVQNNTLTADQVPTHTSSNATQSISVTTTSPVSKGGSLNTIGTPGSGTVVNFVSGSGGSLSVGTQDSTGINSISTSYTNNSQAVVNNVQPSQVVGVWVIRT